MNRLPWWRNPKDDICVFAHTTPTPIPYETAIAMLPNQEQITTIWLRRKAMLPFPRPRASVTDMLRRSAPELTSPTLTAKGYGLACMINKGEIELIKTTPDPLPAPQPPNYLHVYAQSCEHDDVLIIGDANALRRLVSAINIALYQGKTGDTDAFTNDDEGYTIRIARRAQPTIATLPLPYAQVTHPDPKLWDNLRMTLEETP